MSEPAGTNNPTHEQRPIEARAYLTYPATPARRSIRISLVLAGIILGQVLLFGPSLFGFKVLLPLDILTGPGIYLPVADSQNPTRIENIYLSDLVYVFEPARRFFHDEMAVGRWPAWAPWQFAGVPFSSPRFSPFLVMQALVASPVIIAWAQLAVACVAGLGAYAFCRRVPRLSFWPSAVAGWAYPLTGFFVFWQGYPTALPVCWLPWLLLAIHSTVRRTSRFALVALAVTTALVVVSGSLDVAGQVLVVSGLFALWCLYDECGAGWISQKAFRMIGLLVCGWTLGLMLASPYILPLIEYTRTGARMTQRAAGAEERPPAGLHALPQWVLPDMYGRYGIWKSGSFRYTRDSQQESTAAGYAGLVATLFLAPLAWGQDPRRNRLLIFFGLVCVVALCWPLNVPGFVQVLRLPGLNMFSHNRWMFAAAFAVVICAAMGLERLSTLSNSWKRWMWLPTAFSPGLGFYCLTSIALPPEPIATELENVVRAGGQAGWIRDLGSLEAVRRDFALRFGVGAALAGCSLVGWLLVRSQPALLRRGLPIIVIITFADLLWFAHGRSVQASPDLYYPPVAALQKVGAALQKESGRIIGYRCLPANLAVMAGLRDVRGYDAVDPDHLVDLLALAAEPGGKPLSYAVTQWLAPAHSFRGDGTIKLSPLLDLLGVRYVVFRGSPPPGARTAFESPDYWVAENTNALPRAFFPSEVDLVGNSEKRLERMASPSFDPRRVALVEDQVNVSTSARGTATVREESPTRIQIQSQSSGPALLVLADRWDAGWRAWVDGEERPVLRVNHALRGVVVSAGESVVEFRYAPRSFRLGLTLAGVAAAILLCSAAVLFIQVKREAEAVSA